jgi:3-oxoacyl-[acyl-carrier protein] reductase
MAVIVDLGIGGKVALVAAASQGLGRATALALAREGCRVAICARNAGPLDAAARAIQAETHAKVVAIPADVARGEGVASFVDGAIREFGGVDILVPNAGGPPAGNFESIGDELWAKGWELTFQSTVRLVRSCLPSMHQRGGGAVVAILSMSVRQPIDNLVLSNALRLGVVGALKSLAREVAKDRIRVNGVAPGWIATDRTVELHRVRAEREGRRPEDIQAAILQDIPMGRMGRAEEVANLITFLASERAAYITGVIAQIDGGLYRGIF